MRKIKISNKTLPGKYWLSYYGDDNSLKYIDLSGCACCFEKIVGYVSDDNCRAVGWRYEENGYMCYELFNIGHTVFYIPLKPNLLLRIQYGLLGKKSAVAHREHIYAFEKALNQNGWKTLQRRAENGFIKK